MAQPTAAIHQFVAGFARGDAISNEALVLRALFLAWGYQSEIFCERRCILPEWRSQARDLSEASGACGPDTVGLLHLSIGSQANTCFQSLACRKAILYHNVTPPDYFRWFQPAMALDLARGREQVRALAGAATVVLADSAFNARELSELGYAAPTVFPLALDFSVLQQTPDRSLKHRFRDGRTNLLFVGRCAPNKRLEDVLAVFAHYQAAVNPYSRLLLAGSWAGMERYYSWLVSLARDWRLRDVHFLGSVPQPTLNALYLVADGFICMSEHEGFCIPLMESMAFDLPVLAYRAAAVPETLDGAGVLADRKDFPAIAEMVDLLARDPALRQGIIARQRQRLARYRTRNLATDLRAHLSPLLD